MAGSTGAGRLMGGARGGSRSVDWQGAAAPARGVRAGAEPPLEMGDGRHTGRGSRRGGGEMKGRRAGDGADPASERAS